MKPQGGRPSVVERVQAEHNRDFDEVLENYIRERSETPEQVAGAFGVSVQALMKSAQEYGFRIVRRIERRK